MMNRETHQTPHQENCSSDVIQYWWNSVFQSKFLQQLQQLDQKVRCRQDARL